ncbi:MAG: N-acetylmuramoyl-L-alanine amidase [Acidobacteriota bacterium]
MNRRLGAVLLLAVALAPAVVAGAGGGATTARDMYTRALERERALRNADKKPTLEQMRNVVNAYDRLVRKFPASGYSDNALWQAGNLALLAYERFAEPADKRNAARFLTQLKEQYPASSLAPRVDEVLQAAETLPAAAAAAPPPRPQATPSPALAASAPAVTTPPLTPDSLSPKDPAGEARKDDAGLLAANMIRGITRTIMPEGARVTIEMDGESNFRAERLENPRRVFFDLKGTRAINALQDATLKYTDDVVREVRLGRHPQNTTRIVFDMEGVEGYSVFTLYNPFRLVIDFKASAMAKRATPTLEPTPVALLASLPSARLTPPVVTPAPVMKGPSDAMPEPPVRAMPSRPVTSLSPIPPAVPSANTGGKFSLARQLGLGVARIVIDAGHGGHDPGAQGNGVSESELVLDVALRLGRLLEKQPGIEVVMTRDTDVFIPLEERTEIANREGADFFLSIHANASRNAKAHGVETYFLNFASNPDAQAVAARENSTSARGMHSLPEIVRAIALNNKLDESRDFADIVQQSMVRRLSTRNQQLRDLGVKQAPFVVLIGAAMPSVLAEISFVTNKPEGQLLKTGAYRQQIAEALFDGVLRYQQSLKRISARPIGMGSR